MGTGQRFPRLWEQLIDMKKDRNENNKFQFKKKIPQLSDGIEKQVSRFSSCSLLLASSQWIYISIVRFVLDLHNICETLLPASIPTNHCWHKQLRRRPSGHIKHQAKFFKTNEGQSIYFLQSMKTRSWGKDSLLKKWSNNQTPTSKRDKSPPISFTIYKNKLARNADLNF